MDNVSTEAGPAEVRPVLVANLNQAQAEASTSPAPILQILAPPGSGKTLTLTARLNHLLSDPALQLPPHSIILCTFTNKAAREITDRVTKLLGREVADDLVVGTFHAVARQLLRKFGPREGVVEHDFGIADRDDSNAIVKRLIQKGGYTIDPNEGRSWISRRKSGRQATQERRGGTGAPATASANSRATGAEQMSVVEEAEYLRLYDAYNDQLEDQNLLDYDDLLLRCVTMLQRQPGYSAFVKAVLVDEFQDTNGVQYEMMKLLAFHCRRITVVGDPDQSIYGFRAADVENVYRMRRDFPDTVVVRLTQNYRSSGAIIKLAMKVISQKIEGGQIVVPDPNRRTVPTSEGSSGGADAALSRIILPTHGPGSLPVVRRFKSPTLEVDFVASEAKRIVALGCGLLNLSDIAILVRSSSQTRMLEMALGRQGIAYKLVGGHRFFDKVEIRMLIDYLRVIWEPQYIQGFMRVVNVPTRGVGASFSGVSAQQVLELLAEIGGHLPGSEQRPRPSDLPYTPAASARLRARASTTVIAGISFSQRALRGLNEFLDIITRGRQLLSDGASPADVLEFVIGELNMEKYLQKFDEEGIATRMANIAELVRLVNELGGEEGGNERPVSDQAGDDESGLLGAEDTPMGRVLSHIALSSSADEAPHMTDTAREKRGGPPQGLTISTLHAAKGLEWPVVFIPGAFDGSIPHNRSEDVAEELRLLYVGVTRGKAMVYLTWADGGRRQTGDGEVENPDEVDGDTTSGPEFVSRFGGNPSRFVKPITDERRRQRRAARRATKTAEIGSADVLITSATPAIDFAFLRSVSRILGRPCPAETDIQARHSQLAHSFDAYDSGSESEPEAGRENRGGDPSSAIAREEAQAAEREARRNQSFPTTIISASEMLRQKMSAEATTMASLRSGQPTVANLTTMEAIEMAKRQMEESKGKSGVGAGSNPSSSSSAPASTAAGSGQGPSSRRNPTPDSAKADKDVKGKGKKPSPGVNPGQGSITSFFSKTTRSVSGSGASEPAETRGQKGKGRSPPSDLDSSRPAQRRRGLDIIDLTNPEPDVVPYSTPSPSIIPSGLPSLPVPTIDSSHSSVTTATITAPAPPPVRRSLVLRPYANAPNNILPSAPLAGLTTNAPPPSTLSAALTKEFRVPLPRPDPKPDPDTGEEGK